MIDFVSPVKAFAKMLYFLKFKGSNVLCKTTVMTNKVGHSVVETSIYLLSIVFSQQVHSTFEFCASTVCVMHRISSERGVGGKYYKNLTCAWPTIIIRLKE